MAQPSRKAVGEGEKESVAALGAGPDAVEAVEVVRLGQHVFEVYLQQGSGVGVWWSGVGCVGWGGVLWGGVGWGIVEWSGAGWGIVGWSGAGWGIGGWSGAGRGIGGWSGVWWGYCRVSSGVGWGGVA